MRSITVYFWLLGVLPLGCATTSPPNTGFLTDYARLEPHPKVAGGRVYWNRDVDRSKYSSIMIDPVEIHFAHEENSKQPDPEHVDEFRRIVEQELEKAISEVFQVSKAPSQGVIRLRTQVSNIQFAKELPRTRSYVPLPRYRLGSANVEVELTDSSTGDLLAAWVGPRRSAGEGKRYQRPDDWEGVRSNIAVSVRTFVDHVMNRLAETRTGPA